MTGQLTTPPWEIKRPRPPKLALLDPDLRNGLWRRSGGLDEVTGERLNPARWEAHHRVKKSQGRNDSPSNLLVVAPLTHVRIGQHEAWAKEHGFTVYPTFNPADVAVLLHCARYVLLDDGFCYLDGETGEAIA